MTLDEIRGLLDTNNTTSKNDAINMGMLQAGLAMLGNSRAGFGPAAMAAGQAGIGAYQGSLDRSQAQLMQKIQMSQLLKKLQTEEILAKALRGEVSPSKTVAAGPTPAGLSQSSQAAFGMDYNPALDAAPKAATTSGTQSYAQRLLEAARQAGDVTAFTEAQKMLLEEKKLAPKFATDVRTVMRNGQPVAVQMADDGTVREMTGFSPAEKLQFLDTGGKVGVGVNPYTGQTVTQGIRKEMSPDAIASNKLGWANHNLGMLNYNKPNIQNIEGVGLVAVDPKGSAAPVMMGGKPIVQEKPMTEFQGKAATFANVMAQAEKLMSVPNINQAKMPGVGEQTLRAIPMVGNALANMSETTDRQQFRQAQEAWVRAALRKESGAVIGKDEMEDEIRTYFPMLGDNDEVIMQKAAMRELKRKGIEKEAGPSYKPMEVSPPAPAEGAKPLPTNPTASNLVKGQTYQTPRGLAVWDGMKFVKKGD